MKEIRNNAIDYSFNSEKRTIEGYAIVFDSQSQLLQDRNGNSFYEFIEPTAINQDVLNRSDIFFLLDHNMNRGILARSNKGQGSLNLVIDERGLKFSFEVPDTALGNEVIEGIKRGDINGCSFAFTVEEDSFVKRNDGYIVRTINKINQLFDCSVVYQAAYPDTTVDLRSLEVFLNDSNEENNEDNIINPMDKNKRSNEDILKEIEELKKLLDSDKENRSENEKKEEKEEQEEEVKEEEQEEKNCDNSEDKKEEKSNEEETEEKEEKDNSKEETKKEEERKIETNLNNKKEIRNNNIHTSMSKKFSLLRSINDVVCNRELDTIAQNVTIEGRKAAELAGVTTNGQIVIPIESEKRFEDNPSGILASQNTEATTYGGEAVPTETFDLMGALRDRMVISQLGARFLSLNGNVEIPIYSGANATWESEIGEAKDGSGKFSTVKFSPKRLTVELPISKQFLIQTSASAEATLRQDLIDCIAEKLQKTMFGDGAGDNVTPAGLFNGVLEDANAFTYAEAVNMEELLETHNVLGEYKYVMHPTAKALLRTTNIDRGSGKFVFDNNSVLGIDAYSTNSVVERGVILGNWSQFYVASFGALDLTVDPYTLANKGQVKLTINAYFDFKEARPEAFVKRIIKK